MNARAFSEYEARLAQILAQLEAESPDNSVSSLNALEDLVRQADQDIPGVLPEFRGRVMALYGMVFLGSTPIGAVITGSLAQHLGARAGFVLGAACALLAGIGGLWWKSRNPASARIRTDALTDQQLPA